MKQLLVLSGKGGTGKTTIATAMIRLTETDIYGDCDVDAPNLHLLNTTDEVPKRRDYLGMGKALIDTSLCTHCHNCTNHCHFNAIEEKDGYIQVNPFMCEGCGLCEAICPANAIDMVEAVAGDLLLYEDKVYFSTAKLKMGSGTSGKLVSEVKKQLKGYKGSEKLCIIDGSPGIGCPVIASVSGVDLVLVVAEPTLSGVSDMKRILETTHHFDTKTAVCVNKSDVNAGLTMEIEGFCYLMNIPYVGHMPYDEEVPRLLNEGKSIIDEPCKAGIRVKEIYKNTMRLL